MTIRNDRSTFEKLLTTKEVANLLGVTPRFLEARRIKGNGPPYISLSSRCIRYMLQDVLAWQTQLRKSNTSE